MSESKFPAIDGGWCDGMGCGRGTVCFCGEFVAMKEEFQRVFDKAWDTKHPAEGQDIDCINWEKAWRFGTERWDKAWEKMVDRKKGSCEVTMKKVDSANQTVEEICANGMKCLDENAENLIRAMQE